MPDFSDWKGICYPHPVKKQRRKIPIFSLTPRCYAYIGAGLDKWYAREEVKLTDTEEKESHTVGGHHYKLGVAYLNSDSDSYRKYGIQLEIMQSIIDRFGGNDRDLGGLTLQAGYFYRF